MLGLLLVLASVARRPKGPSLPPPLPPAAEDEPVPQEPAPDPLGPFPWGVDAGPVQGTPDEIRLINGVVWAPFDFIILSGTDEDLWPASVSALPFLERQVLLLAQEQMATQTDFPCRIKGVCTGKDMATKMKAPVTRAIFVGYHIWLAMMAGNGGDSAKRQVPKTDAEVAAYKAAIDAANATILAPDELVS